MSRDADNLCMLHQMREAKSGGILDIRSIVQNFNLGPVGINPPNADDCAKHSGRLKLDDIASLHRRMPRRLIFFGFMSSESLTHKHAAGTHASMIMKVAN